MGRNLIGEKIDIAYQITREVGAGAFATVYEAENAATGNRVALKVYKPEYSEFAAEEAVILRKLDHSNILHLYDFNPQGFDGSPSLLTGICSRWQS